MADEKIKTGTLTVADGIRFGVGFFIVNVAGLAAIGAVAWVVVIAARYFGLTF